MLNFCLFVMIFLVSRFMPWRAAPTNYVDFIGYAAVVFASSFALGMATFTGSTLSTLCLVVMCFAMLTMIIVGCRGLTKMCMKTKKQFEFFISHHKAAAGAFARLLKMMILEARPSSEVFIDSDNLANLDHLFDTLGTDVETVIIVATAEFLKRPWCVGEVTIANIKGVRTYPLYRSDFKKPDADFINNYRNHVPDVKVLTENNISLDSVRIALEWFNELACTDLQDKLLASDLDELLTNILTCDARAFTPLDCVGSSSLGGQSQDSWSSSKGGQSQASCSRMMTFVRTPSRTFQACRSSRSQAGIMVAADENDSEAMATARILCKLLTHHGKEGALNQNSMRMLPEVLADISEDGAPARLTTSTTMVVLVLTNGCFNSPSIINVLFRASEISAVLMPVVGEDSFRFPSPDFYDQLHNLVLESLQEPSSADRVVSGVFSMFKRIAALFDPHGSQRLLEAQSYELYSKVKAHDSSEVSASFGDFEGWKKDAAEISVTAQSILNDRICEPRCGSLISTSSVSEPRRFVRLSEQSSEGRVLSLGRTAYEGHR